MLFSGRIGASDVGPFKLHVKTAIRYPPNHQQKTDKQNNNALLQSLRWPPSRAKAPQGQKEDFPGINHGHGEEKPTL
ncbi:hypothetical protein SKAU_G00375410 [Synaphobranchus kaupii]|uniref:Uncharacterized protein n=1 Tax=Synaphobranchus kaupii TaxID=118154 RepID=A0A9Q1EGW1_SYNKA|nr:hypothetical protein SKAU_G00375410 [Synaphobranchus kaupii]